MSIEECTFFIGKRCAIAKRSSWFAAGAPSPAGTHSRRECLPEPTPTRSQYARQGPFHAHIRGMQVAEKERRSIAAHVAAIEPSGAAQPPLRAISGRLPWTTGPPVWVKPNMSGSYWPAAPLSPCLPCCFPLSRLFIDRTRRHVEVMQFAQSLFLRHGLPRRPCGLDRGHVLVSKGSRRSHA